MSRGGYVTNILFLADRTALVKQAKDDFKNYLPDMSLCNLCTNKDDRNARIVFSTYPTILNAIDNTKTKDEVPLFSPAHFDLIITDESHRSIFKKYRAIFEYFDAIMFDQDNAMSAFSVFINDRSLNQKQLKFILKFNPMQP